ncbi:MAG: hypothetical protein N3E41_05435 [Thermofilaceae archaeon]|nr:hypothetical protein [Thermofilaceae archaeon]
METKHVKIQLTILANSLLGALGGLLLNASGLSEELEGPFIKKEGIEATLYNTILFVSLLLAGALLLLVLIRIKVSLLKVLGYIAFAMAVFLVSETYSLALGAEPNLATVASLILTTVTVFSLATKPSSRVLAVIQVSVGSLTGSIIAAMVPPVSVLAMLSAAAAYDLYSVYWGPLKHLLERFVKPRDPGENIVDPPVPSPLTPFAVNLGEVALGMGDIVLYGALSSLALLSPRLDFVRLLAVIVAIGTGMNFTLKLLKKKGYAPALPIPVLLSITVYMVYNAMVNA